MHKVSCQLMSISWNENIFISMSHGKGLNADNFVKSLFPVRSSNYLVNHEMKAHATIP